MNRNFKLRFDQMKEGNPTEGEPQTPALPEEEFTRPLNLCLVWPDGKRFFLSYSYLIAGELNVDGEKNEILLYFSSHTVTLRGYGLEALFTELLEQLPKMIVVTEERYTATDETNETTVVEIKVQKVKE